MEGHGVPVSRWRWAVLVGGAVLREVTESLQVEETT